MKFGVELLPNRPVEEVVEIGCRQEEIGVDQLWVADHFNNRNIYCVLTGIAVETSSVSLGPGVTNPYVVHPGITASAISTVDEVSGGRAMLGLGAGDRTTINKLGLDWDKPVSRTQEAVYVIRRLVRGERLTHDCDFFELDSAKLDISSTEIPIFVGGQGPKMLEMAGLVGDGVLINASHPKDIEVGMERVLHGRENSDYNPKGDIEVVAHTCFSVDSDREKALDAVRPVIAFVAATAPEKVIERHNISLEERDRLQDKIRKDRFGEAKKLVTDKMIDAFSISGTPGECKDRIEELISKGVDTIVFGSPYGPEIKSSLKHVEPIVQEYKE
ncbi:Coenzyme F420-dependent N5N10-methylene tetrahydromethanopterin reductase Mer [Methanonatronarchaeum thermophilum]|uniref:5,10-methylenetetrahydromethanopterin reductase n=1 Tax=Methanonatronarchaeum thermophilum TaxID=1927129 RepID=A0A1Y3GA45_9EURY|nr:5,10-methylenetetrahydromethanopterin reductase [Methanonatronarchaeum thermophilum]OUJ18120.1 Coenzyme F420-dependent N5N10-methylene tetrahydromethanopterin reductase Mer [Methanonatronarchaeum thermophilum]